MSVSDEGTEARRDSIRKLIDRFEEGRLVARSLTVAEAQRNLCRALYGRDLPASGAPKPVSGAPAAALVDRGPARGAEEERLRRGRVSVRGEQLINFEKVLRSSLAALTSAQKTLALYPVSPDSIPKLPAGASEILRVLSEYARRAAEALAQHGLKAAD